MKNRDRSRDEKREVAGRIVKAGSNRQGDVLLVFQTAEGPCSLHLTTPYERIFGPHLRSMIMRLVQENGLEGVSIIAEDNGAWDYVFQARFEACCRKWVRTI